MKLTDLELKQIERAVQAAEQKTRGEIVPLVIRQARGYPEAWILPPVIGTVVSGVFSYVLHEWMGAGWVLGARELAVEMGLGAVLGLGLSLVPAVRRLVVGKQDLAEAVALRAAAEFTRLGVMNTQDRCGILLLIGLFEHQAEIVADRGIHSQVGEGYWQAELDQMMRELKRDGLTPALCSGIARLGELLAAKFPREAATSNELSDQLRRGE
ncbi:MAG: TPM domain-containing protein [Oligoflexia bacterium]